MEHTAPTALPVPACVTLPLLALSPKAANALGTNDACALLGLQLRAGRRPGTKDLLNTAGVVLLESATAHEVGTFLHADGYVECSGDCHPSVFEVGAEACEYAEAERSAL